MPLGRLHNAGGGIPVCASSVIANCPVVFTLPGFAGDSATEKRAQQHLERAALMLRTTEKSIAETAAECGFRNPKYFMTLFKKVYGVTPGQWRNMKEMPSPPPDKA